MDGWVNGWMGGWMGGEAGLMIAYSNQKVSNIGTEVSQFQTVFEIETVWEWETTEPSEIQIF